MKRIILILFLDFTNCELSQLAENGYMIKSFNDREKKANTV